MIYLTNKLAEFENSQKFKKDLSSGILAIEDSQRIVIKSLTTTLAKLINENDLSTLNIEEFAPSSNDDKTVWYLDLLETQLQFSKDLLSDLQEYNISLKEDSQDNSSKNLKAAYYELASNTKSMSEQINYISNTLTLVKHDLKSKGSKNTGFDRTQNDPTYLSEIENLKNELNLITKIKNTLEKQIEQYRKSNTEQETDHKAKYKDLSELLSEARDQIEAQNTEIDYLQNDLDSCNQQIKALTSELKAKADEVIRQASEIGGLEGQIQKLQKPSLETLKRDNMALKSKQREKEAQIKDLQDKTVQLEKDNEKLKDTNKELKKEVKEIKTDCDLKNKQSFRIVQSERDELEEKLRSEIQLRQQEAQKWFDDRQYLDNIIESLRSQNTSIIQTQPQQLNQTVQNPDTESFKSKSEKYKKKNHQKAKKINQLTQNLHALENEKEEYRIKYSTLQAKVEAIERDKTELYNKVLSCEAKSKELQDELDFKKNKYESIAHKESYIRMQNELEN